MLTLSEILDDFRMNSGLAVGDDTVDVHYRNNKGETALHYMASIGDHNAIRLLINSGAEIDAVDNCGNSALHLAIYNVQMTAVSELIHAGADPKLSNNDGITPENMVEDEGLAWMKPLLNRNELRGG